MIKLSDTIIKSALTALISLMSLFAYAQAEYTEVYHGIDVSKYQGRINWKKVATDENVQFVYIKATEGADYVSPTFEQNIKEARKAGLKVGCYHFLRASSYIHEQFKNFTARCRKDEQDLAPLIDIEVKGRWTAKQVADSLQLFADMLEEHYGCKPIIYTGTNFFNKYLARDFSEGYELFIAKYSEDEPVLANGVEYTIWQFTDRGSVKGINADVDQSRFHVDKSLNDILFHPIPRDPNVIAVVKLVKPIISMQMQAPNEVKIDRAEKIRKQQSKTQKKKERKKSHSPSSTTKSTRSRS